MLFILTNYQIIISILIRKDFENRPTSALRSTSSEGHLRLSRWFTAKGLGRPEIREYENVRWFR